MSANKYLLPDKNKLLKVKLDQLTLKLQASIGSAGLKTKEAIIFEVLKHLMHFTKALMIHK